MRHVLDQRIEASNPHVRDTLEYDISLYIRQDNDNFVLWPMGLPFPNYRVWDAVIPLTKDNLLGHVTEAVRRWHTTVVHRSSRNPVGSDEKAFQRHWDMSFDTTVLEAIGPPLAEAGSRLRFFLFGDGDDDLKEVSERLEAHMASPRKLRIISDDCFVPWGLLYDGDPQLYAPSDMRFWDGFWGARHIIDHETKRRGALTTLALPGAQPMPTSIGVDSGLAIDDRGTEVGTHINFFDSKTCLRVTVWTRINDVRMGLKSPPFTSRIVYFYCHGTQEPSPPGLRLTDGETVKASDIRDWLRRRNLESSPLVFINACEGGSMQSRFFEGAAGPLLDKGASGLIGSHTEVPAVFATRYAEEFFGRLLDTGNNMRTGPLMRQLARDFIEHHNNPLGLVYGLYRASDVYVDWNLTSYSE